MTDPTSLPNFQPHVPTAGADGAASAAAPARTAISEALARLEVPAQVDADGDLEFTVNEQTLFARVTEGELPHMRFFGQWQLQEPVSPERTERLARCNDLTLQLNLVKVCLVQDSLVVSAEHVVTPSADLDVLVPLSINHILQAVQLFFQSWLPLEEDGAAAESGQ